VQVLVSATVRSAGGHVSAVNVTVDGAESLGPVYATCMAQAVTSLDLPAPEGQADGEDLVHLPFTVP
jgi:hypothetical protein